MTQAVCFSCGHIKFGSFCPCDECNEEPKSDDDLALSLALSDHHFSLQELEQMGERIRSGERLQLDPQQKADMIDMIRETQSKLPEIERLMAEEMDLGTKKKPWWKFWS